MINPVYAYGGERLYKAGFIKGMSDSAMALNESEPLTREQLASIILEINALKDVALIVNLSSQYSDTDEISDWARPFVAYCTQSGLMQGVGNNIFAPKSVVKASSSAQSCSGPWGMMFRGMTSTKSSCSSGFR